jgi:hypothetical protein
MIVASMIETVIAPRLPSGLGAPLLTTASGIGTSLLAGDCRPSPYDTQKPSRRLRSRMRGRSFEIRWIGDACAQARGSG